MTISKRTIRLAYIFNDVLASVLAWFFFFWYRNHITQDLRTGKFFSLIYSAIAIAIFWCLIYGFWGFYKDYFRKSRIREIYNLVSSVLFGTLIIFTVLIFDDDGSESYKKYYLTMIAYFSIHLGFSVFFKIACELSYF